MAAVGALLVSSGIALMATPTSADATPGLHKDWVCKYVGTPGTGERLKNGNDGLVWVDTSATESGTWFNDAHGSSYVLLANAAHDPEPDASQCPAGRVEISVDIHFVDPTCANENTPSYYLTGDTEHVTVAEDATPAPGELVEVTATAKTGYVFADWALTYSETHQYPSAEQCTLYDADAAVSWVEPTCENENTVDFAKTTDVNVASWETSGAWEPGGDVTVTATAAEGHMFAGDPATTTKVFTHTFGAPEVGCTVVDAPVLPEPPAFVEPTCTTDPAVQLPDVTGIEYVTTGDLVAGGTVEVDATATAGYVIPEGETTHWQYTFLVPTGCTVVEPPVVEPPVVEPPVVAAETVTPTVVHAGLAGTASSARTEQGLALLVAGLLLMAGAGGLVVVKGGTRR